VESFFLQYFFLSDLYSNHNSSVNRLIIVKVALILIFCKLLPPQAEHSEAKEALIDDCVGVNVS